MAPDAQTDLARFQAVFGRTLFIHLSRDNKVEQAVSYVRAEQGGLWHVAPDGSELERMAPHRDPVYDAGAIGRYVARLDRHDRAWADWFAGQGINPLRLRYEGLARDPAGAVRTILAALNLPLAAADRAVPGVRKLADATSRDWVARFHAEQGLSDPGLTD